MFPSGRAPLYVTNDVRRLCRSIGINHDPVYVPVVPGSSAKVQECFFNVQAEVKEFGGAMRYGWAMWQCGRFFVEAEHHAVHESHDGHLIDVTPRLDGETRILFLRDDSAIYEFGTTKQRDNHRLALSKNPALQRYLELAATRTKLMNLLPVVNGRVTFQGASLAAMRTIQTEMAQIEAKLTRTSMGATRPM